MLDRRLVQVVLARRSSLLDRTVKETQFRRRFDAAIIAVHREGERLRQKIGDVTLQVWGPVLVGWGPGGWLDRPREKAPARLPFLPF